MESSADYVEICSKLTKLIEDGPGPYPEPLREVQSLLRPIRSAPWWNTYVDEKAFAVQQYFGMWFSTRRWDRKDGGAHVKAILYADISKLEQACSTASKAFKGNPQS